MSRGVFGLIQARMGSQRLPGKAMLPLAGIPLVGHIVDRLQRVSDLAGVVLATTTDPRNEPLLAYAASLGVAVWLEPAEDDLAARLHHAAQYVDAEAILKVNADCPLVDPEIMGHLLAVFRRERADYASNKVVWSYPKGLSAEAIDREALCWCDDNLCDPVEREYVTDWIKNHDRMFRVVSVESGRDLGHHEWMVDTPEDFAAMTDIFDALYRPDACFGLEDVLCYLEGRQG